MHGRPLHPEADTEGAARRWLLEWGDRLCCAALLAAGVGGAALLGWYVWQMSALR